MGETDLYGENLTWHMVEMLGRQYDAQVAEPTATL